jgi:hypothetical protein
MNAKGVLLALVVAMVWAGAWALRTVSAGSQHAVITPADIKWGDVPPGLPPGAKVAVLYGDPGKAGPFIVRLKAPASYRIMPHTHPTDENLTIISGSAGFGMSERFDANVKMLPAGSFISLPARMAHFALFGQDTVIELSSMGPFQINYVNPADDPRKSAPRQSASSGGKAAQ